MKTQPVDIALIGAGIMSATLASLLHELNPNFKIQLFERLDEAAAESSNAWNNAGTGHSAFCELNYTPQNEDGSVEISKALKICEQFEISKQFWSYLVKKKYIDDPSSFIKSVPHCSFVYGDKNVNFLKSRYETLSKNHLFKEMKFMENPSDIEELMPLVMKNRKSEQPVAATVVQNGTDVNFEVLTKRMLQYLDRKDTITQTFNSEVTAIKYKKKGYWKLKISNLKTDEKFKIQANFVFIGAGGGSLLLLQDANIQEAQGYGGFPVGGQWLKCINKEIINKHHVKVYGKASLGAPPMSVPHLDTRIINGKKELLFGPFAGFSTKFLKNGSYVDFLNSIELDNIKSMFYAGWNNFGLTKYLIEQVMQSDEDRIKALQEYFPEAKLQDWQLLEAGQRVQVIKQDKEQGGILEFGTELITANNGSLACLLGASPGASTSVSIILEVIKKCFSNDFKSIEWQEKLKNIIPSFKKSLKDDEKLTEKIRSITSKTLKLV